MPALRPNAPGSARAAAELAALVRETVTANAERDVLLLSAALLSPGLDRPHHRRLLRDALEPALAAARTRVFDLPNGDVVAVAPPPARGLDAAGEALARVLDSAAEAGAVRRLRLPEAAAELLAAAAASLGLDPAAPAEPPPPGPALDPAGLALAERALAQADLEPAMQAQAVCRLDPDGTIAPGWEDRRIAWPRLAALLLPGCDLDGAPALLRRLGRLAETRLLAEAARPAALRDWRPIGLALSPETLAGAAFARFEAALPAGRPGETVIGLRPADLLADPGALPPLRQALRERGFRLALDDAEAGLLDVLPPARLGLDLLRLRWTPELPAAVPAALAALLAEPGGPGRVVLAGVDRAAALAWGWEVGIRLFQGPLVERRRRQG